MSADEEGREGGLAERAADVAAEPGSTADVAPDDATDATDAPAATTAVDAAIGEAAAADADAVPCEPAPVDASTQAAADEVRAKSDASPREVVVTEGPPPREPAPGDRVGARYVLVERLGGGAMGTVWAAEDATLARRVAVKLVREPAHGVWLQRLAIEARETAAIHHPSVVRVLDFGLTSERTPFLVLELLEGELLSARVARGRMPEEDGAELGLRLAHALELTHSRGLLHRDIKPENVMLARIADREQPKLLDFGLAKVLRTDASRAKEPALTGTGKVVGSPEYMSPEQARGHAIGTASDVWSLSVVLYECLAGVRPFRGPTVQHTLRSLLQDAPAPIPFVDPGLAAIVSSGLMRDPTARWSASRLGDALAGWLLSRGRLPDPLAPLPPPGGYRTTPPKIRAAHPSSRSVPPTAMPTLPPPQRAHTHDRNWLVLVAALLGAAGSITTALILAPDAQPSRQAGVAITTPASAASASHVAAPSASAAGSAPQGDRR